ncbi:2-dehydropantoate 2-reductase [Calderihabitans maritimus]|uniref:2-dehydropantoate 2-reductase n=1 Tax=Calderihabitans maritimus TaxID=1246530 RepID=A0A1Z5HVF0_9FIRM|nr:2-dehydropantoate 2-reductase [Calderihabitans maritimus]GAW93494.1 2-dehydropantoate 2-reductase [Calderihabitans maritimus]
MKIAVMGAGAVGSYFGGMLSRAGREVWLVARGAHLEALRNKGLTVESDQESFTIPVRATGNPGEIGPVDLVLFCVKSYDTVEAARQAGPMLGPETVVLSLQNGVENEEVLAGIVGREKVMAGLCYVQADLAAPGLVRQAGPKKDIVFGELSGEITERAQRILTVFREAGIRATLTDDIRKAIWTKFLFISAFSGITAVTRSSIGAIRETPEAWELYRELLQEAFIVGRALGVNLPDNAVEETLDFTRSLNADATSSLMRDLKRGKRLEIDALCGTVVRLGARAGVPTPASRFVYSVLKVSQVEK